MKHTYFLSLLLALGAVWGSPGQGNAQVDGRRPRSAVRTAPTPQARSPHRVAAEDKIAYGILAYDETDIYYQDGLVTFSLLGSPEMGHVRLFGDQTHSVTAGAYAAGYYYVARSTTTDGTLEVAADLLKYDIEADSYTTVGDLTGFEAYVADMTYDYSTGTMYAIERPANAGYTDLRKLDITTGESSKVATLDRRFFTLACTYGGQLYGISFEGDLCRIDKSTGAVTTVGATGLHPSYFQSMDFDHTTGRLYWAANVQDYGVDDGIARVDTVTGEATMLGAVGDGAEIAGLYVPFSASATGTPAAVSDFAVAPAADGQRSATLSWTNPARTFDGQALDALTAVKVYRDKQLIATLTDAQPGATMSYTDQLDGSGLGDTYHYTVVAANATGDGAEARVSAFVGHDLPPQPEGLTFTADGDTRAVLTWQSPETGVHGGYLDRSSLTYEVVRQPGSVTVATGLKQPNYTDASITTASAYTYAVRTVNADGKSDYTQSERRVLGPINELPYTCDFTADSTPDTWTVVDGNHDGYAWLWTDTPDGRVMGHQPSNTQQSDDWLISYYLLLNAGTTYVVDYKLHAYSPDKLAFYLLRDTDTTQVAQELGIAEIEGAKTYVDHALVFKAAESGRFNLAVRALSPLRADWLKLASLSVREADAINLSATTLTGEPQPMASKESVYTVGVTNMGSQTVNSYAVRLLDGEGNELARQEVDQPLESGATTQVDVAWTPADQSVTSLVAEVMAEGDTRADDNTTAPFAVSVREAFDGTVVSLGLESGQTSKSYPFDFFNQHAAAYNLYAASEIGLSAGSLVKISYPYEAHMLGSDATAVPVKVYMANTDDETTDGGWPDTDALRLVYDGTVTILAGSDGELSLKLDEPFDYDGRNLAVVTVLECDKYYNSIYFTQYTSPLAGNSCYSWSDYRSSVPFDFTQTGRTNYYGYTSAIRLFFAATTGLSDATAPTADVPYAVYDLTGRRVATGVTGADGSVKRPAGLRPGVYVVTYTTAGAQRSVKTVLK